LAIGLILTAGAVGSVIYVFNSGPSLPVNTDAIITQVVTSELPDLVKGKTGYAKSGDVNIWYEIIEPLENPKGTILLMTGIATDAISWPPKLLDAFTSAGYQVVRYDHRDTGMSDWLEDWASENPYSLGDMANDGIAILDTLGIEKAHVVGVSMGGMVAQQMSIHHPERVASLTSIMSSCDIVDPDLPPISLDTVKEFAKVSAKYGLFANERNTIKLQVASRIILRGHASYNIDVQAIAEQVLYNLHERQGYNPQAAIHQNTAILASGSRNRRLRALDSPTLIIHGQYDPLIPIEHGLKCTDLIPTAETLWVDQMGHDIPDSTIDEIVDKIIGHIEE
jgi:pimeloyl-ACP methyl ester carboxylesterase